MTTTGQANEPQEYKPALDIYLRLESATPPEKVEIVREALEAHPKRRLVLPQNVHGRRANLEGADLRGFRLVGANLQGANLQKADLEEVDLRGAVLKTAKLHGAVLRSANLKRSTLGSAELQPLRDSTTQGADLSLADLEGAKLHNADLRETRLRGAKLQGADVTEPNLAHADLRKAELERMNLSVCSSIGGIYLADALLDRTVLRRDQLDSEIIGEHSDAEDETKPSDERAQAYQDAKGVYSALKQNFDGRGDYDEAGWAYCKERRMEKLGSLYEARAMVERSEWKTAIRRYASFIVDQCVEWVCDYGESFRRVLLSILIVFLLFVMLYGVTNGVVREEQGTDGSMTHASLGFFEEPNLAIREAPDLALFSLGSMTTMVPEYLEPRNSLIAIASSVQALITIALTGLLGFVLGNRIRRS